MAMLSLEAARSAQKGRVAMSEAGGQGLLMNTSKSRGSGAWRRVAWLLLAVGLFGAGCDTVAEITFTKESLSTLKVLGFKPNTCGQEDDPLSMCKPPGCGVLDFVMETNRGRYLEPNQQIIGLDGRLEPGVNFGSESDIEFRRTWLFQLGEDGLDKTCSSDEDCASHFRCQSLGNDQLPADSKNVDRSVCVVEAAVTPKAGSLSFSGIGSDFQPENDAVKGLGYSGLSLLMSFDNSGSLKGKENGDGNIVEGAATDMAAWRIAAAQTFLSGVSSESLAGNIEYGLFELAGAGQNGVTNIFMSKPEIGATFVGGEKGSTQVSDDLSAFHGRASGMTPVWESFVLGTSALLADASGGYAHRILTFVDSVSDGSSDLTLESALNALKEDPDVGVTVVHLDSLEPQNPLVERTGPLAEYAQLACEANGYYVYETYPRSLDDHLRRLASSYESVWSLEVEVLAKAGDGVHSMSALEPGWYRMAGTMVAHLVEKTATYRFVLKGATFGEDTSDSRLLFHVGE